MEEQWMAPRGGLMLGMSRTVSGDRLIEFEQVMIRADADGLVFTARPSGQPEAAFRSVELTASKAVFENPAHDFPQRVIYELTGEGVLAARIEGRQGERVLAIDFPYRRAACPGALLR